MAIFNLHRFSRSEMLRKIDQKRLVLFLQPYAEYFSKHGVNLPSSDGINALDYDALSMALANPDPPASSELFDALFLVHELSTPKAFDALQKAIQGREFEKEIPSEVSPADLAIHLYLLDADILYRVHASEKLCRPRSFVYFKSLNLSNSGGIEFPDQEQIAAIEAALSNGFDGMRRGKTAKVIPFKSDDNMWFLVRRGAALTRQGIIGEDGQSDSLYYRPERNDIIVYNQGKNEICMNVRHNSKWLLELYRGVFGEKLFGSIDYFKGKNIFTLEPLRQHGKACLECGDVDGIDQVILTDYTVRYNHSYNESFTCHADDIFALLEANGINFPHGGRIVRAKFRIKFSDARSPRSITINRGNRAGFKIDDDSIVLEQWLTNRGFITEIENA